MRARIILLITGFTLGMVTLASAQTMSHTAMPAQGGDAVVGSVGLSWTFGETFSFTLVSGSNALTEGFQQPPIQINTGTVTGSPFCAGSTINVPFTTNGYEDGSNSFTVELSDATGSFASPVTLGTYSGSGTDVSGTATVTIPSTTASGTQYRVRLQGSAPVFWGTQDNGTDIVINAVSPIFNVTGSAPCGPVTIGLSSSQTGIDYQLFVNGTALVSTVAGTGSSISFGSQSTGGTYTVVGVNHTNSSCTTNMNGSAIVNVGANDWTGTVSSDWFDTGNWSCGFIPVSTTNVVIPSSLTNYPQIAGTIGQTAVAHNVSIQSGASIDVLGVNNVNLEIYGDLANGGTPGFGVGKVLFKGSAAQTVSGSSTFKDLDITNASGVTITSGAGNMQSVSNVLGLVTGTLTANGNLTLTSDASGTALADNFTGSNSGTISGNFTVQRYTTNSGSAFFYIGAPVNGASIPDWASDFTDAAINGAVDGSQVLPTPTCDLTALQSSSPYAGIFDYRENTVTTCNLQGWHTRFSGSIPNGQGFIGRVPAGIVIDLTGTFNSGVSAVTSPTLTRSASNTTISKGFNIVANPFAAPVEWLDVAAANSGVQGTAYVFEVNSGNPLVGTYLPINAITGGGQLATSEAFFVDVSVTLPSTTMSYTKSMMRNGTNSYLRTAAPYENLLTLDISGNGFADKARVAFGSNFTAGFDRDYDARKLHSKAGQPSMFLTEGTDEYAIYAQPSPVQVKQVPMSLEPGANGTFTIRANDLNTFDPTALVYLEDLKLHTVQNLMEIPTYTFTSDVNDDPARFVLHFVPAATIAVNAADCKGKGGLVSVDLGDYTLNGQPVAWNTYTISNANGVVGLGNVNTNVLSFYNLPDGNYTLQLMMGTYTATKQVVVQNAPSVVASFTPNVLVAHVGDVVQFANHATANTPCEWQFGDGNVLNAQTGVTHSYANPGEYEVTLVANNGTCQDSYTQTLKVDAIDGIANAGETSIRIYGQETKVMVFFNNYPDDQVKLSIYDMLGRTLTQADNIDTHTTYEINLTDIARGYYFVQVAGHSKVVTQKLFLGKQ